MYHIISALMAVFGDRLVSAVEWLRSGEDHFLMALMVDGINVGIEAWLNPFWDDGGKLLSFTIYLSDHTNKLYETMRNYCEQLETWSFQQIDAHVYLYACITSQEDYEDSIITVTHVCVGCGCETDTKENHITPTRARHIFDYGNSVGVFKVELKDNHLWLHDDCCIKCEEPFTPES